MVDGSINFTIEYSLVDWFNMMQGEHVFTLLYHCRVNNKGPFSYLLWFMNNLMSAHRQFDVVLLFKITAWNRYSLILSVLSAPVWVFAGSSARPTEMQSTEKDKNK